MQLVTIPPTAYEIKNAQRRQAKLNAGYAAKGKNVHLSLAKLLKGARNNMAYSAEYN